MELDEAFGREVRRLRLELKLSQVRLAERVGVTERYLRMVEHGEASPTLAVIVQLGKALEVGPDELVRRAMASFA